MRITIGVTTWKSLSPQAKLIVDHLTDPSSAGISPLEAMGLYRIFRLASRIHELRQAGVSIRRVLKKDRVGKRYARYFLSDND